MDAPIICYDCEKVFLGGPNAHFCPECKSRRIKAGAAKRKGIKRKSKEEKKLNHDATHCADYKEKTCPKSCYRAQLTVDLEQRYDLYYLPISWTNFRNTDICPLNDKKKDDT